MSQQTVAFIVERLLTDRNFRNEFALEPQDTLIGVQREGRELTSAETVALVQADIKMWFWPDEKQGLETLRNALVAFEKSRARQSSLDAAALAIQGSIATTGGDRVTPVVPALSSVEGPALSLVEGPALSAVEGPALSSVEGPALSLVEGPRYRVFDGGGSPPPDESSPARRRPGFRWLLLALLCFVLAFVLGLATGSAHAAQDKPRFKTEVAEERECVTLHVRPQVMTLGTSGEIRIEARIARHSHHRQFAIAWDGGATGGGSSAQSLQGADEPFLHVRTIKNIPAASWRFVAEVYDDRGKVVGRDIAAIQMPEDAKR